MGNGLGTGNGAGGPKAADEANAQVPGNSVKQTTSQPAATAVASNAISHTESATMPKTEHVKPYELRVNINQIPTDPATARQKIASDLEDVVQEVAKCLQHLQVGSREVVVTIGGLAGLEFMDQNRFHHKTVASKNIQDYFVEELINALAAQDFKVEQAHYEGFVPKNRDTAFILEAELRQDPESYDVGSGSCTHSILEISARAVEPRGPARGWERVLEALNNIREKIGL